MGREKVEVVRELFERLNEIEFARLREALATCSSFSEANALLGDLGRWQEQRVHPEIEIDASRLPTLPQGNLIRGREGWFEFWRSWLTVWESFEYTPRRWLERGDRIAVESEQRGRLANGIEYATKICNVWTFEGEQVIRLQMFEAWEEAIRAADE